MNVGLARKEFDNVDAKLVNPFIDAFISVMPQIGFPTPKRIKVYLQNKTVNSSGVIVSIGFTRQLKGKVAYNMNEDTAKFIASTMMMGMPVAEFDAMANMLTATSATNLTALDLAVDISPPSLTVGAQPFTISDAQFLVVEMDLGGHKVDIAVSVDRAA